MWCIKCDRDLSECVCADLKERLERLRNLPFIHAPSMVDKPLAQNKINKQQPKPKDN